MNTFERRNAILSLVNSHGSMLVADLSKQLSISEVTIRTDLRVLEEQKLLTRFHGGAGTYQPKEETEVIETRLEERHNLSADPKKRIAAKAAAMVNEGDTVILDSGSTTMLIAYELLNIKNITVITNNLPAASILSDSADITLVICGGYVRHKTRSMHGTIAENALQGIRGDIMFVGADGINPDIGLTTFNEGYNISTIMANASAKVVAVVDATKFNRNGFNVVLPLERVDTIITDHHLSSQSQSLFHAKQVQIKLV